MAGFAVSRRVSEFAGVALFALALIWFVALATYSPADPVWFFNTGPAVAPGKLCRPGRGVHGRALVPAARLRRLPDPAGARGARLALLLVPRRSTRRTPRSSAPCCCSPASRRSCPWRSARSRSRARRSAPAATSGMRSRPLLAIYLNRTGSIILILTLLFLSIILSTQFSFGRLFVVRSRAGARDRWAAHGRRPLRPARGEAAANRQRQEVIRKHLDKAAKAGQRRADRQSGRGRRPEVADSGGSPGRRASRGRRPPSRGRRRVKRLRVAARIASRTPTPEEVPEAIAHGRHGWRGRRRAEGGLREADAAARHQASGADTVGAAAAAARSRQAPGGAQARRVRSSPAGAARRAERRAQDRRARADGRGPAARGEVPRVLGRGLGRADPSRARS